MTKRKKLSKPQLDLKQKIINAYSKSYGFLYVPSTWDNKLWKKSTRDIHEYIQTRFRETLDTIEYYSAMVFLWKTVPNSELLVEFHQSPQWLEAAKTYNHTSQNTTSSRSKQNTTECSTRPVETVKSVDTVHVIGDD